MWNRMCDTNQPSCAAHKHGLRCTLTPKMLKGGLIVDWGRRPLASSRVSELCYSRWKGCTRADCAHTHMNIIMFQLNGSMLIAFHTQQQSDSFIYTHMHTVKGEHKWCLWGRARCVVWWGRWEMLPSLDAYHTGFGNVFAFLPGRRLHTDTTGLFLGAMKLVHIQYQHHFRLKVNTNQSWDKIIIIHC